MGGECRCLPMDFSATSTGYRLSLQFSAIGLDFFFPPFGYKTNFLNIAKVQFYPIFEKTCFLFG